METPQRTDSGQITLMIIGFVMIVVLTVGVVANASKAFVYRRSLASWADGAAVAAAQQVAENALYAGPAVDELPISSSDARNAVADYVSRNRLAHRFEDFAVAVSVDASTATVTVEFAARVPLVLTGAGDAAIPITAEATATAPLS
jgi:uncharacterized membrane protein